jgi:hypothetical protein
MSEQSLGAQTPDQSGDDASTIEASGFAPLDRRGPDRAARDTDALRRFEEEQLARDIADIERASAALRRAEPALKSWSKPAAPAAAKPRPLWLLIAVLWLSTAILTAGAFVAIATLAG